MALLKRVEFAEKCGVTQEYLTQYIKRGKVLLTDDGLVDEGLGTNKMFFQSRLTIHEIKKGEAPTLLNLPLTIDHLTEGYNHPYRPDIEKKIAALMVKSTAEANPFSIIPTSLVYTIVAECFIEMVEYFLNREIQTIESYDKLTSKITSNITSQYANKCIDMVTICFNDLDRTVSEIVEDYQNEKNKKKNQSPNEETI